MVATVSAANVAFHELDSVPVVSRDGDRSVVWLEGAHDIATVHSLTDALVRVICIDECDVVVDLSGVTFIGAATVGVLRRAQNFLRARGRHLTVRSPSTPAARILDLCGLTALVEGG
jgi:anti-anti-sigma factor